MQHPDWTGYMQLAVSSTYNLMAVGREHTGLVQLFDLCCTEANMHMLVTTVLDNAHVCRLAFSVSQRDLIVGCVNQDRSEVTILVSHLKEEPGKFCDAKQTSNLGQLTWDAKHTVVRLDDHSLPTFPLRFFESDRSIVLYQMIQTRIPWPRGPVTAWNYETDKIVVGPEEAQSWTCIQVDWTRKILYVITHPNDNDALLAVDIDTLRPVKRYVRDVSSEVRLDPGGGVLLDPTSGYLFIGTTGIHLRATGELKAFVFAFDTRQEELKLVQTKKLTKMPIHLFLSRDHLLMINHRSQYRLNSDDKWVDSEGAGTYLETVDRSDITVSTSLHKLVDSSNSGTCFVESLGILQLTRTPDHENCIRILDFR